MIAFCIGSGPSLTAEDVEQSKGFYTVAVNSSWEVAPHCDVVYGGDFKWWRTHHEKVSKPGATVSKTAARLYGLDLHDYKVTCGYNSGMLAIHYAQVMGAEHIVLLGYDCSVKHGLHHHADHPEGNPSFEKCVLWRRQFKDLARRMRARVYNCSRYTELDAFPRFELADCLSQLTLHAARAG